MVTKSPKICTNLTCLRFGKNMTTADAVVKGIVVEDDVRKEVEDLLLQDL